MKILFCTDGSKISYNAVKNLSGWVKDAIIDIICVIDWSFLPDEVNLEANNFSISCANVADSILNYAENLIKECGFTVGNKIKSCGSAIESILDHAEGNNYDLILMGSNGKKGLQKWLGSVSQEIINGSSISDFISKVENNRKKILFTTDGTECAASIIEDILSDFKLDDKEVYVCMVIEDPKLLFLDGNMDQNWILDIQREQQRYAQNSVNSIQTILLNNGIKVKDGVVLSGHPSQEIIKYSKEKDIDLIVLGSRNKSKLDRMLIGSESKRVLENTKSDVWLARCKK